MLLWPENPVCLEKSTFSVKWTVGSWFSGLNVAPTLSLLGNGRCFRWNVSVWEPNGLCPKLKQEVFFLPNDTAYLTSTFHLSVSLSLSLSVLRSPFNLPHTNLFFLAILSFCLSIFSPCIFFSFTSHQLSPCTGEGRPIWPIFSLASRQWHAIQADYFVFKAHENNGVCVNVCAWSALWWR